MIDLNLARLDGSANALAALNEEAKRIIKERPGLVLLGAVAVGFALGRLLSRR